MNYLLNFNKEFGVLILNFGKNVEVTNTKKDGDIFVLYNNDEVVGFNIFNLNLEFDGNCTFNKKIIDIVNKKIEKYLKIKYRSQFFVAKIVEIEDIEGTHLHKCKVSLGDKIIDLICGASNAKKGLITVCAVENSMMPSGDLIKNGKIKGFNSFGMLCSSKELFINDFNKNGILELNDLNYKIGDDFYEVYFNEKN